nr:transposase [Hymenolepis microstoma]
MKKSADCLRLTGLSQTIMLKGPERVGGNGSNVLRVVILPSKIAYWWTGKQAAEDAEFGGKGFLVKTRVKLKMNYQNQSAVSFKAPETVGNDSERRILGTPRVETKRCGATFACEQQKRRDFSIVLLLETKNGYITITLSAHRKSWDCPLVILLRQHLGRTNIHGSKFMLCVWWGDQLDVIYYELPKTSETITDERYRA